MLGIWRYKGPRDSKKGGYQGKQEVRELRTGVPGLGWGSAENNCLYQSFPDFAAYENYCRRLKNVPPETVIPRTYNCYLIWKKDLFRL